MYIMFTSPAMIVVHVTGNSDVLVELSRACVPGNSWDFPSLSTIVTISLSLHPPLSQQVQGRVAEKERHVTANTPMSRMSRRLELTLLGQMEVDPCDFFLWLQCGLVKVYISTCVFGARRHTYLI